MKNLVYTTNKLEKYFSSNRIRWSQFYESERVVIEKTAPSPSANVLDIGCGCGGLGLALKERFGVTRYTGVEINRDAAASAKTLNPEVRILCGDFLEMGPDMLAEESYDLVFSLSCIDWNLAFDDMLVKAWAMVKPGGMFIASFRLTADAGINDMTRSYQYINYDGRREGEIAPYVVLNGADLMRRIRSLEACRVFGYGYYGPPSKTAVTPYQELCFAALAVGKPSGTEAECIELRLPLEIVSLMRNAGLKA